jgi:uncharacterized protein YwgA
MNGTPWQNYGLIAYIAQRLHAQRNLGKTKLQKLVYLMKELEAVPVDHGFRFYNYGPYSDELTNDLDFVSSLGGVKIDYNESFNAYEIAAGENADKLITKAQDFLTAHQQAIDLILDEFGRKQAKDLELIATVIYARNKNNQTNLVENEDDMIDTVAELKPKFSRSKIKSAMGELKSKGYLRMN